MNKKMIFAAMAVAALAACEKKEVESSDSCDELVSMEIRMPVSATKVAGQGGDDELSVSDYQVFIYNATSRVLEAYATPSPAAEVVNMRCTAGPKEVVVLANAPDLSSMVSYDKLLQSRTYLSDNSVGKLVMEGKTSHNLTFVNNKVTVNLKRTVAKVVLAKIETDFELQKYNEMDFILKEAYLINVAADKTYLTTSSDPASWYNKLKNTGDQKELLWDSLGNTNIKETKVYESPHHFYSCPNPYISDSYSEEWSPRTTRLVVEAELGGKTYYYPVMIKDGLRMNTEYYITMKIVRPGSVSPGDDMMKNAAVITIDVKDWDGPVNITETI